MRERERERESTRKTETDRERERERKSQRGSSLNRRAHGRGEKRGRGLECEDISNKNLQSCASLGIDMESESIHVSVCVCVRACGLSVSWLVILLNFTARMLPAYLPTPPSLPRTHARVQVVDEAVQNAAVTIQRIFRGTRVANIAGGEEGAETGRRKTGVNMVCE